MSGIVEAEPLAQRCRQPTRSSAAVVAAEDQSGTAAARSLAERLEPLDLFGRLAAIRSLIPGRLVLTTSFGLEDQAIAHAIFAQRLPIAVATLDTGRLFPETHDVWAETERRYGVRVLAFAPVHADVEALIARQGIDGLRSTVAARLDCCAVRKLVPLERGGRRLDHRHSR